MRVGSTAPTLNKRKSIVRGTRRVSFFIEKPESIVSHVALYLQEMCDIARDLPQEAIESLCEELVALRKRDGRQLPLRSISSIEGKQCAGRSGIRMRALIFRAWHRHA